MSSRLDAQAILSAPKFKQLRAERAALRWTLSLATLVTYFGLILLVLTERSALGVNIPGTSTPIWFALIFVATLLVVVSPASTSADPIPALIVSLPICSGSLDNDEARLSRGSVDRFADDR
jgi:uncharacterized membrane protein (DUF485 family)